MSEKTTKVALADPVPAKLPRRYKVLSSGLTGANGAGHYRGEVLHVEQIGDADRIAALLARKSIEEVS